jgi:hypothetical protein
VKSYTLEGVYEAQLAHLMDEFIGLYDRDPNVGEEDAMRGEARQYAKEFMENLADWQNDQARDARISE